MTALLCGSALAGVFGLVMGCFANTLIYRLCTEKPVYTEDCICPSCGHRLTLWEQIPVLGYGILKGKCRYCGAPIGIWYPLTELGYAVFYAAASFLVWPQIGLFLLLCAAGEALHLAVSVLRRHVHPPLRKCLTAACLLLGYFFCIGVGMGILSIGLQA